MDHAEALEQIELAAVEPDGLERLAAGDTPDAAAVAGHLAGCASCAGELARIERVARLAREAIQSRPDPALRERTLGFVREVGRDRAQTGPKDVAPTGRASAPAPAPASAQEPARSPLPAAGPRRSIRRRWAWLAVAVIVVMVGAAGYLAGAGSAGQTVSDRDAQVALLADAAQTAIRIQAESDARQVALRPTAAGAGASGSILLSVQEGELVALATGLAPLSAGQEYGCWVEASGQRVPLGSMYWAGDVWTWAGPLIGLEQVAPDAQFGVSLGPIGGSASSTPLLVSGP